MAAGIGYCGLDARRAPLDGTEIRPCWQPIALSTLPVLTDPVVPLSDVIGPEAVGRTDRDPIGGISPARR